MTDKPWKRHERRTAVALGGERVPVNGRGDQPDVSHSRYSIECKERKALPAWLLAAVGQAKKNAAGRLPIVVLHQLGGRGTSDLVVVEMRDFQRWLAPESEPPEAA